MTRSHIYINVSDKQHSLVIDGHLGLLDQILDVLRKPQELSPVRESGECLEINTKSQKNDSDG
jgi:hypothetical protein